MRNRSPQARSRHISIVLANERLLVERFPVGCSAPGSQCLRRGRRRSRRGMVGARYLTSAGRFLLDPAGDLERPPCGSSVERVIGVVSLPSFDEETLDERDLLLNELAEQTAVLRLAEQPPAIEKESGWRYETCAWLLTTSAAGRCLMSRRRRQDYESCSVEVKRGKLWLRGRGQTTAASRILRIRPGWRLRLRTRTGLTPFAKSSASSSRPGKIQGPT